MNNRKFLPVLFLIFMAATLQVQAERYKGPVLKNNTPKSSADCFPPAKNINLALNNVRALLKTNGTMWFLERAEYEVPKGSGKTSLFSSSLWIGGMTLPHYEGGGDLYMAAMRFAQRGNDYWTGPIRMSNATIDPSSCAHYDQFYRITRVEVERHKLAFLENDLQYQMPKSIEDWPAHGRSEYGESRFLAPFVSSGAGDPLTYQPELGDYPYYDLDNELCPWTPDNRDKARQFPWRNDQNEIDPLGTNENPDALPMPRERIATKQDKNYGWDNKMIYADHVLKGDETIFWFLNDVGGTHTETSNKFRIGLEIRVQAFAFATNDELNKMTFYSYEIINRGNTTLYDTYFSQWCDPDLGYSHDDFVGCDVIRGLGYCYNGKEIDGNGELWAYGANPPVVGLDFFQGPYIDPDGTDNPKFHKEKANANGNPTEIEYCNRFVGHIFDNLDIFVDDAQLLSKYFVIQNTGDTVRWNDQFAINGVNFGDSIIDNERFGMRAFTYHNNTSGPMGDPTWDYEYYNFLTGKWGDGTRFTYGGDGYSVDSDMYCDFVFPRGTDYCNWGTKGRSPGEQYNHGGRSGNWSELSSEGNNGGANTPNDRRWMQSAGPFTLKRGACNYITVGVPWARSLQGTVEASIALLMVADDKCQALFENCFKILDGPDAPTLTIKEYDQKLIILLTNSALSNNANEDYRETDQTIPESRTDIRDSIVTIGKDTINGGDTVVIYKITEVTYYDRQYRFEGYQIFQVSGPEVGANDLDNPSLARLVRQFDIENYDRHGNPIGKLINWEFDEELQLAVPKEKVNGSNNGIQHSFEITQDAFATGSRQLVNYKTYYFIAVAYAYNEYLPYIVDPDNELSLQGQKLPYLRGRKTAEGKSVTPIPGVPHPPTLHGGGSTMNSDYGSIPYITRIDGQGNGGIALDLSQETIDKIMEGGDHGDFRVRELKYAKNAGPLNIKVVDPLRVKPYDFTLVIRERDMDRDSIPDNIINRLDVTNNAYWVLSIDQTISDDQLIDDGLIDTKGQPIRKFVSTTSIGQYHEQIIMPLGISIAIYNTDFAIKDPKVRAFYSQIRRLYRDDVYKMKYAFNQTEKIDIPNDIIFETPDKRWITGLVDDNILGLPSNWIRAGNRDMGRWSPAGQVVGDFTKERLEDFHMPTVCLRDTAKTGPGAAQSDRAFKDYLGKFGTVCGGTWAPYVLTSPHDNGPQAKYTRPETVTVDQQNKATWSQPAYGTDATGLHNYYDFKGLVSYFNQPGYNQTMTNLYSVNVVITPDKSKWTRCVVIESCQNPEYSEGGALKGEPRKARSVGKDGKPDGSKDGFTIDGKLGGEYGMGWFPGYAINIETGERLNMMFAENSDSRLNNFENLVNGRDMIFNPTSTYAIVTKEQDFLPPPGTPISKSEYDWLYQEPTIGPRWLLDWGVERVWGGMHYVYVCNSSGNTSSAHYLDSLISGIPISSDFLRPGRRNFNLRDLSVRLRAGGSVPFITWEDEKYGMYLDANKKYSYYDCGPYDEGQWLVHKFAQFLAYPEERGADGVNIVKRKFKKMQLFNNVMYAHVPMQPEDPELKSLWLSSDVTYKIRVTRPYLRYISRWYEAPELRKNDYSVPEEYEQYIGFPVYKLTTRGLEPTFNDPRQYQSILDNINIVPNPYYGSSLYETNALESMVKITNLPTDLKHNAPVTINIFTVGGILVRTLTKGDSETSHVNWDLKNNANIPIASGVYIIHVNCPGIGERMLKFFCTMRQTDLNTF